MTQKEDGARADIEAKFAAAEAALREGDLAAAKALAQEMRAAQFSGCFEIEAQAALAEGDVPHAVEVLEEGLAVAPQVWRLWLMLGNSLSDLERWDDAEAAYGKALGCPECVGECVRANLAIVRMRRGDLDAAARDLDALLAEGVEDDDLREFVESAKRAVPRQRRGEQLAAGTFYSVLLDVAAPAGVTLPDAPEGPLRYKMKLEVAAQRQADLLGLIQADLDEPALDPKLEEVERIDDAKDCYSGVYWASGRVYYSE